MAANPPGEVQSIVGLADILQTYTGNNNSDQTWEHVAQASIQVKLPEAGTVLFSMNSTIMTAKRNVNINQS